MHTNISISLFIITVYRVLVYSLRKPVQNLKTLRQVEIYSTLYYFREIKEHSDSGKLRIDTIQEISYRCNFLYKQIVVRQIVTLDSEA